MMGNSITFIKSHLAFIPGDGTKQKTSSLKKNVNSIKAHLKKMTLSPWLMLNKRKINESTSQIQTMASSRMGTSSSKNN